ncbi:MAG: hypothetical protein ACREB2_03000 [Pseudolabrys sp.]
MTTLATMRSVILSAMLVTALSAPASADGYPVNGAWGQSTSTDKGAIDCGGKRVITFSGNQRQDSNGGVPAYRNKTVTQVSSSNYRVVDEFTTGQISDGRTSYTLQKIDDDHIAMQLQQGGTIKLQRCK